MPNIAIDCGAVHALADEFKREIARLAQNRTGCGRDVNPYFDMFHAVRRGFAGQFYTPCAVRDTCAALFSWAVPSPYALDTIERHGPIVEIGAGTGYWAWLLRSRGVDVLAFDRDPSDGTGRNLYHVGAQSWSPVEQGGPEKAAEHSDRTLMLCWPPYADPMASDCLKAYRGQRVIFIGEHDGCTGDDEFHSLLENGWEAVLTVDIPNWDAIHDDLTIYARKP